MMNSLAGLKTAKKKYFTQSQSALPVSHSREEFTSIIEKKREYQTLIKKELQSLQEIENQEKQELQKWQHNVQNNKISVKAFTLGFKREEKSQEQFIRCFKQLRILREKRQFMEVFKALKIVHNQQNIFKKRLKVEQQRNTKAFLKFKRTVLEEIDLKDKKAKIKGIKNLVYEKKVKKMFRQMRQIINKKKELNFQKNIEIIRKKAALKYYLLFIESTHKKNEIYQKIYKIQQLQRHHSFQKMYKVLKQEHQNSFCQRSRQLNNLMRERVLTKAKSRLLQSFKPNLSLHFEMVKSLIRSNAFKDIKKGMILQRNQSQLSRTKSFRSQLFACRFFRRIKQLYSRQQRLSNSKEMLWLSLKRRHFVKMIKFGSNSKISQINQNIQKIKQHKIKNSLSLISKIINTSIIKKADEQIQPSQNSENSLEILANQIKSMQFLKQQTTQAQSNILIKKYVMGLRFFQFLKFIREELYQVMNKMKNLQQERKKSKFLKFFVNFSRHKHQQLSAKSSRVQKNIKRLAFTQFLSKKQASDQNLQVQSAILRTSMVRYRMKQLIIKLKQLKNESLSSKVDQFYDFFMQNRVIQFYRNLIESKRQNSIKANQQYLQNKRKEQIGKQFLSKLILKINNLDQNSQRLNDLLLSSYFQNFKESIQARVSIKHNTIKIHQLRKKNSLLQMKTNILQKIGKKQIQKKADQLKSWLQSKFSNKLFICLQSQLSEKNIKYNYNMILNLRRHRQLQNLLKGIIQKKDDQQYHKAYNIPNSPKYNKQSPSIKNNNSFANYLNNSNNHNTQQFQNYLPIQHQISPSNYLSSANQDDYTSQESPQKQISEDFQENVDKISIEPSPLYEKLSYELYQSNYNHEKEHSKFIYQNKTENQQDDDLQSQQEQQEHLQVEEIIQNMQNDISPSRSSIESSVISQISSQSGLQILHKCFNSLKMFTNQKKTLKKFLQIQKASQNHSVSYYPISLEQKRAFESFLYRRQ